MEFEATSASAVSYALEGRLDNWVHEFLMGEGNNEDFALGLQKAERRFHAPEVMALDRFVRCCGPEDGMLYRVPADAFQARVDRIKERYLAKDWDMPPLIVSIEDGSFVLNDGNHRFEALKQLGIREYWVIIWETIGSGD